ncbi:autotransporter assembly complex family protein [Phenylobacterium sp.]|uniref:autotransporter assembly complex protein TamA n=1 Tax=Phenylobacterium sp. TaxID=1871053 RepID=UPI0011F9F2FB|nr:autotransporter assembly complex family protein [Phenylobacterium sp.]THD58462.1 MAG: outer membrane protein assembly factor [Phenylobacterium sp.]
MSRLVYAVGAGAALCLQGLAYPAEAAESKAQIEGTLAPDLRAAVIRAVGDTDRPIGNRFEARRRAREAAEDAIAVLRSEGYYAYDVEPDVGEGDAPKALVKIAPGPRFVLGPAHIDWIGATPDPASLAAALSALALTPGQPGRAADVVAAEGRVVGAVQKRGYADAKAEPREVVVDHADNTVSPDYRIAAGPLVHLDSIQLTTHGRTHPEWLQNLAPWTHGAAYDPDQVAELERRLLDTGVYESVTVSLAPDTDVTPDGLRPVVISLAERDKRTLELGASYDTTEGLGLDAKWTRYSLLGRADTFSVLGRVSDLDSRIELDLSLPHWLTAQQTLALRTAVYRTNTPAYDQEGVMASADVTHRWGRNATFGLTGTYFTWGGSIDVSRTEELGLQTLTPLGRDLVTFTGLVDMALDRSDNPLDPTRGWRISARIEPTLLTGDGEFPFLKLQGQASGYIPFDTKGDTVLAARLHLGSITNGTVGDIPAPQRFFAGGGGSVRGFGYQEVGPRLSDNTPEGGLSLAEISLELRRRLNEKWGLVVFLDGGTVGSGQLPNFQDASIGAGVGVRYNLGFGPIRVDLATPVTSRRGESPLQVYVSIGQSF